jgi:hypothetical protein
MVLLAFVVDVFSNRKVKWWLNVSTNNTCLEVLLSWKSLLVSFVLFPQSQSTALKFCTINSYFFKFLKILSPGSGTTDGRVL